MVLYHFFFVFLLLEEFFSNKINKANFVYVFYLFVFLVALAVGVRGNEDEYSKLYYLSKGFDDFFYVSDIRKELIFEAVIAFYKEYSIPPQFIYISFSS